MLRRMHRLTILCLICVAVIIAFMLYHKWYMADKHVAVADSLSQIQEKQKQAQDKLSFTINHPEVCDISKPWVIIMVHSAPHHIDKRNFIRQTWLFSDLISSKKIVILFLFGGVQDPDTQLALEQENKLYGDVIQDASYLDSYKNLSFKSVSMLSWTATYCEDIKLLLKADDDTLLIPNRMRSWLLNFGYLKWPKYSVIGRVWDRPDPIRDPLSKWYVSEEAWPDELFSQKACSGAAYFITGDAVSSLLAAVNKTRFLWLEDMYTTGVLGGHAQVTYVSSYWIDILKFRGNTVTQLLLCIFPGTFIVGSIPDDFIAASLLRCAVSCDNYLLYVISLSLTVSTLVFVCFVLMKCRHRFK